MSRPRDPVKMTHTQIEGLLCSKESRRRLRRSPKAVNGVLMFSKLLLWRHHCAALDDVGDWASNQYIEMSGNSSSEVDSSSRMLGWVSRPCRLCRRLRESLTIK